MKAKTPTIMITGAPLSGGGVLTRILSLLGCAAPSTLAPAKAEQGAEPWESQPLGDINAQLLAAAKTEWSDWRGVDLTTISTADHARLSDAARGVLKTEFPGDQARVFKDPRNSLLQSFWTDLLGDRSRQMAIIMIRNPIEVSGSLSQHFGVEPLQGTLLWLRYTLDAEHGSRTLKRMFVSYDDLLQSHRAQIERLETGLGLTLPNSTERAFVEVANYLSGSLRNHRDTNDIFRPLPHASEWVANVYRIMRSWVLHGENRADHAVLDAIRAEMGRAAVIFAPVVRDHAMQARKLGSISGKLAKEEAGRASERKKLDQTIEELQQKLAAAGPQADVAKWEKELSDKNKTVKALQEAVAKSDAQIAELTATLDERQVKISSFRRELQKREAALAENLAAQDALKAQLSQSMSEADRAKRLCADLEKEAGTAGEKAAALQAQLAEVTATTTQQQAEISALRAAAALHEKALADRDGLMKGAMEARDGADGRLAQLTEKFTEQLTAYQVLMQEKSAVEVELVRSGIALEKAGHDLAWVEGEKQGLRRDIADRDGQLERLQAELEAAREQNISGGERATALANDLAQRGDELTAVKSAADSLQKALDEQSAAFAATQDELDKVKAEQRVAAETGDRQAAQAKDAIAALEKSITDRDGRIAAAEDQLATLGVDVTRLREERDGLLQQRDADAEGLKNAQAALAEQENLLTALKRDSESKAEQLSMQAAQMIASRAKQTQLQQERLAIGDQLKQAHEELEQVRGDLTVREDEAENLAQYLEERQRDLDAARAQAAKDQEVFNQQLQQARADAQGLERQLLQTRGEAQGLKNEKAEMEQLLKLRLDEVVALKRDVEVRDGALTEHSARLKDVESNLAQTQSALLQRQLETEEAAEELRFLRSQLKEEQEARGAKEEQLRLTDEKLEKSQAELLAEKDQSAKAELDHEKTLQARFQEIALLMTALKEAQEKETDLAHLRVVRHELSRRTDSLYLLFVRVMDALLAQVASPLLPRKVNLRRQQAVLEKYGLFDAGWYLENNRDVYDAGMDATAHFVAFGLQEGRTPNRAVDDLRRSAAVMAEGKGR
ncbi:sulfotransferase family protein [Sphingobium cupriresistens]|uniref:Uncharacterized protein n=1 Tax=Sphingobium cupriresistens LL01 TaxID=1420583 RepID=A0A0J7Y4X4_9SPHN|nr:sulfotransferase family protein [Sphingobium cupriresistens]KMS58712.1 hypothetical protein V473_03145 [Sphingobium cupriresistens LL01]